jgi:hypothetical protein
MVMVTQTGAFISGEVDDRMLRRAVLDLELACRHEGIGVAVLAKDRSKRHAETLQAEQALLNLVGSSH